MSEGKADEKKKLRKLPPKEGKEKPAPSNDDTTTRKQSLPPRQESTSTKGDSKPGQKEQDLKSALSDEQREDLGELVVGITNRMRQNIEDNFDSYATLTKLSREDNKNDPLENLDFDPGTVDINEYDKERKLRDEREKELSNPKTKELKDAAIHWFDDWRVGFLKRVDEALEAKGKVFRQPAAQNQNEDVKNRVPPSMTIDSVGLGNDNNGTKVENMYPRISTSLTKLSMAERTLVVHSLLLLLLSLEHYNAASRVFLLYLTSSLKLGFKNLREDEEKVAQGLLEAAKQMSVKEETMNKVKGSPESRKWKIRLATVAGAAIVGVTGGYAAPVIAAGIGSVMGGLGLEASAAAGYLGSMAGNAYVVGSLFGAYGGRMTGDVMQNLSADVEDFGFLPVHGERKEHEGELEAATGDRRLRVVISLSGWLLEKEEVITPWNVLSPSAEVFALRFELEALMKFGQSIKAMSANDTYGIAHSAFKNRTVVTDFTSNIWPLALVKLARVIENPFSVAKNRADKAGKVLAEAIMERVQGERPVTLIGYSVGARVIWSCLMTLAERKAFGFIESVVLIGAPIPSDISTWRSMRTVVSGRLINVYSRNDYLLAFLHRASSLAYHVAGLRSIEGLPGVENVDVTALVTGHLRYRYLVGSILQKIRFEDINKDEVSKEAEAFNTMVEEEKKHDYTQDAKGDVEDMYKPYLKQGMDLKDRAGKLYEQSSKLYEQYGSKSGKKAPSANISDADAEKQVSAMEKDVNKQTEKGLMQWAVEQLYIARPSVPSAEDAKNPDKLAGDTTKTANKQVDAATKSLYQRAKEAVYLSRSGGPEGEDLAKVKSGDVQGAADRAGSQGYLSAAAGYMPTGYIPYLSGGSDAQSGVDNATKEAGKLADKSSKPPQTPGSSNKPQSKAAPSKLASGRKGSIPKLEKKPSTPSSQKDQGKSTKESPSAKSSGGVTGYIPSFGFGGNKSKESTPNKANGVDKKPSQATPDKRDTEADESVANEGKETPKKLDKKTPKKEDAPKSGYGSYLPHFGFSGGSKDPKSDTKNQESKEEPKKPEQNQQTPGSTPNKQKDSSENTNKGNEESAEAAPTADQTSENASSEPSSEDNPVVENSKEIKGAPSQQEDEEEPQAGAGADEAAEDDDPERTPTAEKPQPGLSTPAKGASEDEEVSRPGPKHSEMSDHGESGNEKEGDPFKL